MLFDTHCHLTHPLLHAQLDTVLAQAHLHGVSRFLAPAISSDDWPAVLALPADGITLALGIHPWFVAQEPQHVWHRLDTLLQQHPRALVGEIGLDGYGTHAQTLALQTAYFTKALALAQQHHRPIVLHNRKATAACWRAMADMGFTQGGFVHGFSGSLEEARMWLKMGFKIGIGSVLLKPQAKKIRSVVAGLALGDMVLETDAPFMSPDKGIPNHPANTRTVAEQVAQIHHTDWSHVARITYANALAMVGGG